MGVWGTPGYVTAVSQVWFLVPHINTARGCARILVFSPWFKRSNNWGPAELFSPKLIGVAQAGPPKKGLIKLFNTHSHPIVTQIINFKSYKTLWFNLGWVYSQLNKHFSPIITRIINFKSYKTLWFTLGWVYSWLTNTSIQLWDKLVTLKAIRL